MRDVLLEYHHTYDNGLMQDAENIANIAIGIIKPFLDGGTSPEQIREYLNSYEAKPSFKRGRLSMGLNRLSKPYKIDTLGISTKIYVVLITTCADIKGKFVAVNFDTVLDAINTDNNQVISSAVYHELGHLTNSSKSRFDPSQTSIDFKTPLFLSLDEDEYKKVTKVLYRFHMRELKARCFETKMFLEKNKNEDITIQDIYDNRCSDITLMREFIEMLKKGAEEGPDSKNGGILNSISKDTWEYTWSDRRRFGDDKARWKLKCKNTIAYFQKRLDWFKKRIDKIFYDYKSRENKGQIEIMAANTNEITDKSKPNMKRTLLNEVFNIKTGMMSSKGGKYFPVAYIDDETSETTYPYKDEIKKKYGAQWLRTIGKNGVWGWFLSNSEEGNEKIYRSQIKPCLEYLMSVEKTEGGEKRDIMSTIDELHDMLLHCSQEVIKKSFRSEITYMTKEEIEKKLLELKSDIMGAMSSEEFKSKIEPILKRWKARGFVSSGFKNPMLILIQDPKATDVRTRTSWEALNREIVPNALAICLFKPMGDKNFATKQEREEEQKRFIQELGKTNYSELSPGEKERLKIHLNSTNGTKGFKLLPNWFDVRFTRQIEGKEDLYGNEKPDLKWNNDNGAESEGIEEIIEAALSVAQEDYKLTVEDKDEEQFGGALGYATYDGKIALRNNFNKNVSNLSTIVHEMSHCLLHFKYAHSKNPELKEYFIGTAQGRGLVEQQAEISAYIILRQLGFDEEEEYQLNYVAGWGGSIENVSDVFDAVSGAANEIVMKIINRLKKNDENEKFDI